MPRGINPATNDPADNPANNPTDNATVPVLIGHITASDFNPRKHFDPAALTELSQSIGMHGVLQPIVVRPINHWHVQPGTNDAGVAGFFVRDTRRIHTGRIHTGQNDHTDQADTSYEGDFYRREREAVKNCPRYEIVAGERRYRAAKQAGLETVPTIVQSLSYEQAVEIAVTENLQRQDLSAFEEAHAFDAMLKLPGMTQARVALRLNCSQTRIARTVGLLRLPQAVRDLIDEGKLSPSHGQRLLPYVDFPQVCTSLALVAADQKWPATRLDGAALSAEAVEGLLQINPTPVRELGRTTRFAWRDICPVDCPHKAYRPHQYTYLGVCLRPDHYDLLQKEHDEARAARQAEESRKAVEAFHATRGDAKASDVPRTPVTFLPVLPMAPVCGTSTAPPSDLEVMTECFARTGGHLSINLKTARLVAAQSLLYVAEQPTEQLTERQNRDAIAEAAETAEAEAAETAEAIAATLRDLPSVREMRHDAYQHISGSYATKPPPGCTRDCPCRGLAKGYSGDVIEICSNPARYNKLAGEGKKQEKLDRRGSAEARLARALRVIDDGLPPGEGPGDPIEMRDRWEELPTRQIAAVAVFDAIHGSGHKFVTAAATRLGLSITADYYKPGNYGKRPQALDELAKHSSRRQIALCTEVRVRKETADAIEYAHSGGTPKLIDFLLAGAEEEADLSEALCKL